MRATLRHAILFTGLAALSLQAQPPGGGRGAPPVRSPEVAADGKVTFRLRAPNAKEVFVSGIGQRIAMQKDEQGIWSATTDVLKPDIYTYSFSVDGTNFVDPNNGLFKTSYGSAARACCMFPGLSCGSRQMGRRARSAITSITRR